MTAFSTLTNTIFKILLQTLLPPFSRAWILLYILLTLTCTLILNTSSKLLIPGSFINVITIPSKFGERRPLISMTQYFTTMLIKMCTFSSHLARVWNVHLIVCLVLVLISFYRKKLMINQNFYKTFTLGKMLMTHSARLFFISFLITGIPFVKKASRDQDLTLNFVLIRLIYHPFVLRNRLMVSMKVK